MTKSVDHVNQLLVAPRSDGPAVDDDVLEAVHAVMHRARARQHELLRAQAGDTEPALSPMEVRALGFFARHPGATLSELVAHSGRDKGQIARLLGGLKDRGLLEAEADATDRRTQRLRLSAAAEQQHRAVQRLRQALSATAAAGLDADERRQLLALLARVKANLGG